MQLHNLAPAPGSTKSRKRVGRGHGSGHGKTSGRGENGQLSRAGGGKRAGFEGGQNPLAMRMPFNPGFKNINRVEYAPVNVGRLEEYFADGDVVDRDSLVGKGIIKKSTKLVKLLGDGELTKSLTVRFDKVSESAAAKIQAAGGKVEDPC
jgi:large subunit ribosomal protein L15